ncbi:MAG TPA: hypothetical protein VHO69_11015 [Phototrophicaceae bacterium]|nr:hypothetical protein [Phototrophicaceae bacterium]
MSYNVTDRSNLLTPKKPRQRGCLGWGLLLIFFPVVFAGCFVLGPVISLFTGQMALVPGDASQFDPAARFE